MTRATTLMVVFECTDPWRLEEGKVGTGRTYWRTKPHYIQHDGLPCACTQHSPSSGGRAGGLPWRWHHRQQTRRCYCHQHPMP